MSHSPARQLPRATTTDLPVAAPTRPAPASPRTHGHLWVLPDGTGLHAPHGELAVEDHTGRLCCHLCGRWFVSLGCHVLAHGYTADTYRQSMGLCRSAALTAASLSSALAARQAAEYRREPELRARLAAGHEVLHSQRAELATPVAVEPAQRVRRRRRALAAGRATTAARRERQLAVRLEQLGHRTLHAYLRAAYAAGASLATLACSTDLGRGRLRQEVEAAGIVVRPTGHNTESGKRSRALATEASAATGVGTDDLSSWLAERHAAGWTLTRLGAAVGHSTHWVRWRLPVADPGRSALDPTVFAAGSAATTSTVPTTPERAAASRPALT